MPVLALHPGDLHLRAAWLGALDAPYTVEDAQDPARFVTPSVIALDAGGALLGHPALMAGVVPRAERVMWRYRRAALGRRSVVARDLSDRGLTSDAVVALALRRLGWEAGAYASEVPQLAVVLPNELPAAARAGFVALATECVGRPVAAIDEDDALFATLDELPPGAWLVASCDDDALRLRVVAHGDVRFAPVSPFELEEAGLAHLRARWLSRWQDDAATLVPGATAFGEGDSYEFERIWQETWECLDEHGRDTAGPWPLVRQSTVLPQLAHLPALRGEVQALAAQGATRAASLAAQVAANGASLQGVVVVGPPLLGDALAAALVTPLALPAGRCRCVRPDAYARGAAALAAQGAGWTPPVLERTPHRLCVLGLDEAGRAVARPLLESEEPLPASVAFTLVADRDAQRQIVVTLTDGADVPQIAHRFVFGPLPGQGMQRVTVNVEWGQDGSLAVAAADRDTGVAIACADRSELAGDVALAGAAHLRPLFAG
jgi:hypothetical protein